MVPLEIFVKYIQPLLPDLVVRWILRIYLGYTLKRLRKLDHPFKELRTVKRIRDAGLKAINDLNGTSNGKIKNGRFEKVAEETASANEQHYEVPTEFFYCHLGPLNKYSACEWNNASNIKEAELQTFDSYIEKMNLFELEERSLSDESNQNLEKPKVLEVGNGWGSFILYASSKFPSIDFVGFSNSATQIKFIREEAKNRGLSNVRVLKLDINDFCIPDKRNQVPEFSTDAKFDRIISIECLEHSRNYYTCFKAMHDVLNDDGKVFLHILCHREFTYFMNQNDWMGRNFFTGGTIPSTKLFQFFNDHLKIKDTWYLHGTDYGKTLDAWLHRMQEKKKEVISIFKKSGYGDPYLEFQKWRMFYLMSSESFAYGQGNEWMVAYYLLRKTEP